MFEQIGITLAYVKHIDAKLDNIMERNSTQVSPKETVNNESLNVFPMKTVRDLEEIENKPIVDNIFLKNMVNGI